MNYRWFVITALLVLPCFGCKHINTKEKVMTMDQPVMRKELLTAIPTTQFKNKLLIIQRLTC